MPRFRRPPFATLLLVGGLFVSHAQAVAPAKRKGRSGPGNGGEVRGRGDRDVQARVQNAPLETRTNVRQLQLDVLNHNQQLPPLRQQIATAKTDEIKRAAWDRYYAILYGEMRRRKPQYVDYINLLEQVARSRYIPPGKRGEALDDAGFDRAST